MTFRERWERRDELQTTALGRYGVSEMEWEAMICPGYEIHLPLPKMARITVVELEGHDAPVHTAEEYLPVLESMVAKGWLGPVESEEYDLEPHSIGFTRRGYWLHRRILSVLWGKRGVLENDHHWQIDEERGEIVRTFGSRQQCQKWLAQLRYGSDRISDYLPGQPIAIVGVEGPTRTGTWKPSRFVTRRCGWQAAVRFRKLRRRRFRIPAWEVDGWIDRFEPVAIDGKLGSLRFLFNDTVSWHTRGKAIRSRSFPDSDAVFSWVFWIGQRRGEKTAHESSESGHRNSPLTVDEARALCQRCIEEYRCAVGIPPRR